MSQPWADTKKLAREIHRQVDRAKTAPTARYEWTDQHYRNAMIVMEQLEYVKRCGWWTAERIIWLKPIDEAVLGKILRVKIGLDDFRGQLAPGSIAHALRCGERNAQLSFQRLEPVQIIETERRLRAVIDLKVNNWFWEPERPHRHSQADPPAGSPPPRRSYTQTYSQAKFFSPSQAESGVHAKNISEHVLSKTLSSERTPYPLFPREVAGAAPLTPPERTKGSGSALTG